MTTQHTPTPWAAETYISDSTGLTYTAIYPSSEYSNRAVTNMADSSGPLLNADANAAFIVRACNAHEELLKWAKAVFNNYDGQGFVDSNHKSHPLFHLGAAIAKAEGK